MDWAVHYALLWSLGFTAVAVVLTLVTPVSMSLQKRIVTAVGVAVANAVVDFFATWIFFGNTTTAIFATSFNAGYFVPLVGGSIILVISMLAVYGVATVDSYDGFSFRAAMPAALSILLLSGVLVHQAALFTTVPPNDILFHGDKYGILCDVNGTSAMVNLLHVQNVPQGTFPDVNPDHLIRVTPDAATNKAQQVLGSYNTYLKLGTTYLQKLDNRWVYIVDLAATDGRTFNAAGARAPGYIVVDAEDPQLNATLRTGFAMRIIPGLGWPFDHDLNRYVYYHFTLPYAPNLYVQDLGGMEVRDGDGRPFYLGTLMAPKVGLTGLQVVGMIAVDPQTGEITRWNLNQIPSWVDRIYPQDYVESWASDWWLQYANHDRCQRLTSQNQYQKDSVSYQTNGADRAEYVITYTSLGSDTSLNGELVVNPTTGSVVNVDLSSLHWSTQTAAKALVEKKLVQSAGRGVQLNADQCQLQQILSTPVWYCTVYNGNNYTGVALVQTTFTTDVSKVLYANDTTSLVALLQQQLAGTNPSNSVPNTQGSTVWTGTVTHLSNVLVADSAGNSYRVFQLQGKGIPPAAVFWVAMPNNVAALMQTGDTVTVYVNLPNGKVTTSQHLLVSNIIDNNLPPGTVASIPTGNSKA